VGLRRDAEFVFADFSRRARQHFHQGGENQMVAGRSRPGLALRAAAAWAALAIFMFPLYWWFSASLRTDKEIFNKPPTLFPSEHTLASYKVVLLGISPSSQSIADTGAVHWGESSATFALPALVDSLVIALASTALALAVSLLAAYALSRMRFSGRGHFIFWVLSTRMMPPVAAAIPMFFLFRDLRLIDTYTGAILIHALMNFPLAVLLLKSFIDDIPPEIDDAATIDGASRPLIFARLILPSIRGGIAATAVLCFVFSWTEFLFILSLTQAGVNTVPVAASTFVTSTGTAWGHMAALTCAATLPAMIFIMLVQKHLVRGLTLGSLKG
jgi:multiple sugar transport system permease protein